MEFKVGDRVRIKSWEQMEKEFGINYRGDIKCGFVSSMSFLCGRTATIESIYGRIVKLTNWSNNSGDINWGFSTDIIELVDTSKFKKSDLQDGDIVTDREGYKSLFYDDSLHGSTTAIDYLTDDLKDINCDSDNDIVKVERPIKLETIFERKEEPEVREMTVEEISEALGYEVKVVKNK